MSVDTNTFHRSVANVATLGSPEEKCIAENSSVSDCLYGRPFKPTMLPFKCCVTWEHCCATIDFSLA
jgi:hypothetical protein